MPTGTGKTETMLAVMISNLCSRVVIIVPSDALRKQITDKFLELGILQAPEVNVLAQTAMYPFVCSLNHTPENVEDVDSIMAACQVCVSTSAILGTCSPEIRERFAIHCSYLFIDEAHHVEARTWARLRTSFSASRILQFTATPFREDGKLIEGVTVFRFPLRLAQAQGYFTKIRFKSISLFDKGAADKEIATKAIAQLKIDTDSGFRHVVMARTATIERAVSIAKLYRELAPQLRIVEMHTKIRPKQRARDKSALIAGQVDIVVCVDMLGEGFDLPQLKVAAFHDVRQSLAITLQLAGRFTRARGDLGDATFIADISDPSVSDELKRLYTQDPDWNLILPQLAEDAIGEQAAIKALVSHFGALAPDFSLESVRPATSAVVYSTRCADWNPANYRVGIPNASQAEQVHHSINREEHMIVIITGSRVGLAWTEDENVYSWEWELYVAYWNVNQQLLFINGSSNKGDFHGLAKAITDGKCDLVQGERAFRVFGRISLLRLQSVGLSQFQGRNIRYTQRMGADVDPSVPLDQRTNSQKAVIAGFGFEKGAMTSIGASKKGRLWSHQRDRLNGFITWCNDIGSKLNDSSIDPDEVFKHCLTSVTLKERPPLHPILADWPERIYLELEKNWILVIDGKEYLTGGVDLFVARAPLTSPLRVVLKGEEVEVQFELNFIGEGENGDFSFTLLGEHTAMLRHGAGARDQQQLATFFNDDPPTIWFADGSALEGNRFVELKVPPLSFDSSSIQVRDWSGIDITKESQGTMKDANSVQGRLIRELKENADYLLIFDDDSPGELADVITVTVPGGLASPERIDIALYHCKYSGEAKPGARIGDLYEVCGQAQKSIWWSASIIKKADVFTHMMRREERRAPVSTRIERGSPEMLMRLREIAKQRAVTMQINIVQPGLSKQLVSEAQLRLLGVTQEFLRSHFEIPFGVIASD